MKKIWTTIVTYILIIIFVDFNIAHSKIYMIDKYDKLSYYYSWMNPTLYYHIKQNCKKYNVPEELICAIVQNESGGRNIRHKRNKNGTYDYGMAGINEQHVKEGVLKGKSPKILLKYKYNFMISAYQLSKALEKAKHVKISKKDKVQKYQGIIKEACRMYNQGRNGKRDRYKNWKYTERIYADYRNLTEKL